jgi:uncharacterized protein YjbJ (UPF0337 family)
MSFDDKAENKAQELKGTAKERWGGATGDRDLQAEGAAEKSESRVKQAGEHLKDAAHSVKDVFKK